MPFSIFVLESKKMVTPGKLRTMLEILFTCGLSNKKGWNRITALGGWKMRQLACIGKSAEHLHLFER